MIERKDRLGGLALVALLACRAVWGPGQVASKVTLAEVPPLLQAAARSIGAAVLVACGRAGAARPHRERSQLG